MRACGSCQLCCRLVPVESLKKPAGVRCIHQRHGKGCGIYENRPRDCRIWSCRWLVEDDTGDQKRPDRSHLVIDMMPDFIRVREGDGEPQVIPVVQVWIDPRFPDAHKDPAFRAYVLRRAEEGKVTLVRFANARVVALFAPPLSADGEWHEIHDGVVEDEHTVREIYEQAGLR